MRDETAVSPVIGTLLVLAIFVTVTAAVIFVGRPQIVELQERQRFDGFMTQFSRLSSEIEQLAVAGNVAEVGQVTLALPGGSLSMDNGHVVAVSIALYAEAYEEVDPADYDPAGESPDLYILGPVLDAWTADDTGLRVVLNDTSKDPLGYNLAWDLALWDGTDWRHQASGAEANVIGGDAVPVALPASSTLGGATWRIRLNDTAPTPDTMIGEVYIYRTGRLVFTFDGESATRQAFAENAVVFAEVNGRYSLRERGLYAAPDPALGSDVFTLRAAVLEAPSGIAASGHSKLSLLLQLQSNINFDYSRGAALVRLQIAGEYPAVWYNHLADRGFTPASDSDLGVYYVRPDDDGNRQAFALHNIHSRLNLRLHTA